MLLKSAQNSFIPVFSKLSVLLACSLYALNLFGIIRVDQLFNPALLVLLSLFPAFFWLSTKIEATDPKRRSKICKLLEISILMILLCIALAPFSIGNVYLSVALNNFYSQYEYGFITSFIFLAALLFWTRMSQSPAGTPAESNPSGRKKLYGYIGLAAIILVYVIIRLPYLSLDFSGDHSMKYSSLVEPAVHMLQEGPLVNERDYMADPISLPTGSYDTYGTYPIVEFGLYSTYKLTPFLSIETSTRIFMSVLGILILISFYFLLNKFLDFKNTLLFLLLLSTNIIFQFFTYVTVLDPVNILFFNVSLLFFLRGIERSDSRYLYVSGVLAGIGINIKYDALILYAPVFIALGFLYKKEAQEIIASNFLMVLPSFILETIFFRISLRYLIRNPIQSTLLFLVVIIIHAVLYIYAGKIQALFTKIFRDVLAPRYVYISSIIGAIPVIYLALRIDWIQTSVSDFITDKDLLFNWPMYQHILGWYSSWLSDFSYFVSLISALMLFKIPNRKAVLLLYSFLATSLVYFVLASKVLYFHIYYHHFVIFTFCLFLAAFVFYGAKSFRRNAYRIIFIALILIAILPAEIQASVNELAKHEDSTTQVGAYIKENSSKDNFFIIGRNANPDINFYAGRKSIYEEFSFPENVKLTSALSDKINSGENLYQIMHDYDFKFYVTKNPVGIQNDLIKLFIKDRVSETSPLRTNIIECKTYCIDSITDEEKQTILNDDIVPYLTLRQAIGQYYIYEFTPSVATTSSLILPF